MWLFGILHFGQFCHIISSSLSCFYFLKWIFNKPTVPPLGKGNEWITSNLNYSPVLISFSPLASLANGQQVHYPIQHLIIACTSLVSCGLWITMTPCATLINYPGHLLGLRVKRMQLSWGGKTNVLQHETHHTAPMMDWLRWSTFALSRVFTSFTL